MSPGNHFVLDSKLLPDFDVFHQNVSCFKDFRGNYSSSEIDKHEMQAYLMEPKRNIELFIYHDFALHNESLVLTHCFCFQDQFPVEKD